MTTPTATGPTPHAPVQIGNGHVTLLYPTDAKPNFRLAYRDERGERREKSGTRSPATALERAKKLDADLSRARSANSDQTLGDLVAVYVCTARGRKRNRFGRLTGEDWSPLHLNGVRRLMAAAVQGVQDVPAWAIDLTTIDHMRTACGTDGGVGELTGIVRNFLRWCHEREAITAEQLALLPAHAAPHKAPRFPQPEPRPARPRTARAVGQAEEYIGEEDCPARSDILGLAHALQAAVPWGELAVHTAVATGLREGEQFQLRADDIRQDARGRWQIHVDWQWSSVPGRRTLPKGRKRRVVPLYAITRDGYPLREAMLARMDEARAEQAAGTNPEALLYPAPGGGIWWPSSLSSDLIVPAMKASGWSYTTVTELRTTRGGHRKPVRVTQMNRTWHSLRHRFARDMIDHFEMGEGALMAIGGWESIDVIQARYYRTGQEHLDQAHETLG